MDMKEEKGALGGGASESTSIVEEGVDITPAAGIPSTAHINQLLCEAPPPDPKAVTKLVKDMRKGERPSVYVRRSDNEEKPFLVVGQGIVRLYAYQKMRAEQVPICPMKREDEAGVAECLQKMAAPSSVDLMPPIPASLQRKPSNEPTAQQIAVAGRAAKEMWSGIANKMGVADIIAEVSATKMEEDDVDTSNVVALDPKQVRRQELSLEVLAKRIKVEHREFEKAGNRMLEQAIATGELLILAKERVKASSTGRWLPWLEANTKIKPVSAQTYMHLARHKNAIRKAQRFEFFDSIQRGLKVIAPPPVIEHPPQTTAFEHSVRNPEQAMSDGYAKATSLQAQRAREAATPISVTIVGSTETPPIKVVAVTTSETPTIRKVEPTTPEPTPGFREATELLGMIEDLAAFCRRNDAATVAGGLMDAERDDAATWSGEIRDWLGLFELATEGGA